MQMNFLVSTPQNQIRALSGWAQHKSRRIGMDEKSGDVEEAKEGSASEATDATDATEDSNRRSMKSVIQVSRSLSLCVIIQ